MSNFETLLIEIRKDTFLKLIEKTFKRTMAKKLVEVIV